MFNVDIRIAHKSWVTSNRNLVSSYDNQFIGVNRFLLVFSAHASVYRFTNPFRLKK